MTAVEEVVFQLSGYIESWSWRTQKLSNRHYSVALVLRMRVAWCVVFELQLGARV